MESTSIQKFSFEDVDVRVEDRDGNPWFVAKDVCEVLEISKYRDACSKLDDDEKDIEIIDSLGGPQKSLIISESGLYRILFRSNKPKAKEFSRWVRKVVLPSIRKAGLYNLESILFNLTKESKDQVENFARYVYLLQCEKSKNLKIGISQNVEERVKQLQTANCEKLNVIDFIMGDYDLENELHTKFKNQKIRGEWFKPSKDIFEYFKNEEEE